MQAYRTDKGAGAMHANAICAVTQWRLLLHRAPVKCVCVLCVISTATQTTVIILKLLYSTR